MDGVFGTPGTGSLMSGNTATVTEVKSVKENGEVISKYVWGKLDRPDILVGGNFGESFETQSMNTNTMQQDNVLPPPDNSAINNDPLPTSPKGGNNGSYNPTR